MMQSKTKNNTNSTHHHLVHSASPLSKPTHSTKLRNVQVTVLHFMSTELVGDLFSSLWRDVRRAVFYPQQWNNTLWRFKLGASCFFGFQANKIREILKKKNNVQESQRKIVNLSLKNRGKQPRNMLQFNLLPFLTQPMDPEKKKWTLFSLLNMYSNPKKFPSLAIGQVSFCGGLGKKKHTHPSDKEGRRPDC